MSDCDSSILNCKVACVYLFFLLGFYRLIFNFEANKTVLSQRNSIGFLLLTGCRLTQPFVTGGIEGQQSKTTCLVHLPELVYQVLQFASH